MPKIICAAENGTIILVEEDTLFYQVNLYWPGDKARGNLPPPEGSQMVELYPATEGATSEEIAYKWGPWVEAIFYDDELPVPPEIVTMVEEAWADYRAGRGFVLRGPP